MHNNSITDTILSGKKTLSLEFFPPKTSKGESQFQKACYHLKELDPNFTSITYGAGGTDRSNTVFYAKQLKEKFNYNVMPHLTCIGHSLAELSNLLETYQRLGFKTLMALRGDIPLEQKDIRDIKGFNYASELVSFINERFPYFEIGVGGYPEKHPEAVSLTQDIDNLKLKVESGASFITTQFFFENSYYYKFLEICRSKDINCPIIPGLVIPNNIKKIEKFCSICGTKIPAKLKNLIYNAKGKEEEKSIAVGWIKNQIEDLLNNGAPGFHLYVLNKAELTLSLYNRLISENILKR